MQAFKYKNSHLIKTTSKGLINGAPLRRSLTGVSTGALVNRQSSKESTEVKEKTIEEDLPDVSMWRVMKLNRPEWCWMLSEHVYTSCL